MMPRSVTVQLKSGVTRAVLPDNRTMVQGKQYTITYEDWLAIASGAKANVIDLVSFNNDLRSVEGIDLTTNTSNLPTYVVGGNTYSRRLGQTTPGFAGELFRLVRLVDGVNAAAGSVAAWVSKTSNTVTVDRVGGSSWSEFAGVFVATVTAGNYGWIQVDGEAPTVLSQTSITANSFVEIDPTTDGVARASATPSSTRFGIALTATSGATPPYTFSAIIQNPAYKLPRHRRPKRNLYVR